MTLPLRKLLWGCLWLALRGVCSGASGAHPLDPLSRDEIADTVAILGRAGVTDATTSFALIDLDEPDKSDVLAAAPPAGFARRAFVVVRQQRTVHEGIVNLQERRLESWKAVPDVQSRILPEEWERAQNLTKSDAAWQRAMEQRGYDPSQLAVFCAPLPAGYVGDPSEAGRRLLKVTCFDTAGTSNLWARPIEGLYAIVDLDEDRVVGLIDSGPVPVSRAPADYGNASVPPRAPLRPAPNQAPQAPNFTLDGYLVRWNSWSFRYRLDPRTGLVLSLVRYDDRGRERLVLYRGSLAEIFVPYMDPDPGWAFRTYLDVGEFGLGPLSLPLTRGTDCPADAAFLDATLADAHGNPRERSSVICLFERSTGSPLWRHAEVTNNTYQGRPSIELVMRTIASLGYYDYVIDWVLTEAGEIRTDVGATGIAAVKGVRAHTLADPSAPYDAAYGDLVAPNLVAVNHDHFFSFRLDVDVDGQANTLVRRRLVREALPPVNGRRDLWRVAEDSVGEEGPLAEDGHGAPSAWRIVNRNLTNSLSQHPGYELRANHSAISLLGPDDISQRRAAFSAAPLWITAYDRRELYAAGDYPNQSRGGDGLPAYVARHRPVANADIVLWYTMGFHHLTRPEDWPVMSTTWHSISLVPYGFFDRNPALDVPTDVAPGMPIK